MKEIAPGMRDGQDLNVKSDDEHSQQFPIDSEVNEALDLERLQCAGRITEDLLNICETQEVQVEISQGNAKVVVIKAEKSAELKFYRKVIRYIVGFIMKLLGSN